MTQSSLRRKSVTVFCLIIANTLFAGLVIYLDSYSVSVWDYETEVGPASVILTSTSELPDASAIKEVEGVSKAANFKRAWANIVALPPDYDPTLAEESDPINSHLLTIPAPEPELNMSVRVVTFEQDMLEQYPTIFNITDGRWPEAPDEVALSAWLMDWFYVDVGAVVTYRNTNAWIYHTLNVVGAYDRPEIDNRNQWYYYIGDMVAMPEMLGELEVFYYSYIEIDRSSVSPFTAVSSLESITETEEGIRNLDPRYASFHLTRFGLDDVLAKGIQRYLDWIAWARVDYIIRAQMSLFLAVVISTLTIRFNVSEQSEKKRLLMARGATRRQVTFVLYKETIMLASISFLVAIGAGVLVSRIGLITNGFYIFQLPQLFIQPILITIDSFIYMGVFSLLLPSILFSLLQGDSIKRKEEETEQRRIGKILKGVRKLRWDVVVVFLSLALIVATWELGSEINSIPLMAYTMYSLPLFLAVGIASLLSKGMQYTSNRFSRGVGRISSRLASSVGARRLGKNAKSAGPTIFLIALALSVTWNSATVATTIPNTALSHARFAIGGDISVRLDPVQRDLWSDLMTTISEKPEVAAATYVGVHTLSLSSEIQDTNEFVAVDPEEYTDVGFDEFGQKLEVSLLGDLLATLAETRSGAIVTIDIAESYDLVEGDSLRAFRGNGSDIETIVFNIIGIVEALPDTMVTSRGYHPPLAGGSTTLVGKGKIWIDNDYAIEMLGVNDEISMFICSRLHDWSDGDSVLNTIFDTGGDIILGYSTAKGYAEEFVSTDQYLADRSLDTLMTALTLLVIPGALILYIYSNREDRRKEEVLLRVLGTEMRSIHSSRQMEMLSVVVQTTLLLILCAPILLQNTLFILIHTSPVALISYPQPLLPIIPWVTIASLMLLVIVLSSVLMLSSVKVDHTQNLVTDKNGIWDETTKMWRDE